MAERRLDPRTGHVYEYDPERGWLRVTGPESRVGAGEAFVIGAGQGLRELGRGALDLGAFMMGQQGDPIREELARRQAEEDFYLDPLRERHPIAYGLGSVVPELATAVIGGGPARQAGRLFRPVPGTRAGSSMAEQVAIGAGLGATGYEETLSGRVFNAAVGAGASGLGYQLGTMADRVRRRILASARAGQETEIGLEGATTARGTVEGAGRLEVEAEPLEERLARMSALRDELGDAAVAADGPIPTNTRRIRAREAEDLGFELTPGMRAGEGPIYRLEAGFESFPLTSGSLTGVRARNYGRLQSYLARALDIPEVSDLGVENLARAEARIGRKFDEVIEFVDQAGGVPARELANAAKEALEELQGLGVDMPGVAVARNVVEVLENYPAETVSGQRLREMRTYLNKRWRDFTRSEGAESSADVVEAVMNRFDDAIQQRLPKTEQPLWRTAREQWRLLTALRRGIAVRPDGMINIRTFANNMRRTFPYEYARGNFQNLRPATQEALRATRVAETFLPGFPDSGTATRLAPQMLMDQPVSAAALTFGSSLLGDAYTRLGGRATTARAAAQLGPIWPAAPTAAGAIGRALGAQLEY